MRLTPTVQHLGGKMSASAVAEPLPVAAAAAATVYASAHLRHELPGASLENREEFDVEGQQPRTINGPQNQTAAPHQTHSKPTTIASQPLASTHTTLFTIE